jgi:hypothetical protein
LLFWVLPESDESFKSDLEPPHETKSNKKQNVEVK